MDESKVRELIVECRDHINAMRLNSANRSLDELEAALAGAANIRHDFENEKCKRCGVAWSARISGWTPGSVDCQPATAKAGPSAEAAARAEWGDLPTGEVPMTSATYPFPTLANAGETSVEWDARAGMGISSEARTDNQRHYDFQFQQTPCGHTERYRYNAPPYSDKDKAENWRCALCDALAAGRAASGGQRDDKGINEKGMCEVCGRYTKEEIEWWHRTWHRDTGIPCDGTMEVCKRGRG